MSLKHAILVLLETEPSSGYDLLKHFRQSLGYFWNAKHQQVYQQLKTLTDAGHVTYKLEVQEGRPDRKIYAITPSGMEELKHWLNQSVKPAKINDALLVKLYGGHLIEPENLLQELQRHQQTHKKTLANLLDIEKQLKALPDEKQAFYRLPYLTLRRGIIGEQAWLDWANEATNVLSATLNKK